MEAGRSFAIGSSFKVAKVKSSDIGYTFFDEDGNYVFVKKDFLFGSSIINTKNLMLRRFSVYNYMLMPCGGE